MGMAFHPLLLARHTLLPPGLPRAQHRVSPPGPSSSASLHVWRLFPLSLPVPLAHIPRFSVDVLPLSWLYMTPVFLSSYPTAPDVPVSLLMLRCKVKVAQRALSTARRGEYARYPVLFLHLTIPGRLAHPASDRLHPPAWALTAPLISIQNPRATAEASPSAIFVTTLMTRSGCGRRFSADNSAHIAEYSRPR
ncbi:hypothetical protein BD413DRAFT_23158 [Trametes elegans]|nr:hypothetical protein BD413DRAFT_23158 [Trametes elegans]